MKRVILIGFVLTLATHTTLALPPTISEPPEALYNKQGIWTNQVFTGLNITSAAGFSVLGQPILRAGTQALNPSLFIGFNAGATTDITQSVFAVGIGNGALQNLTSSGEDTAVGILACNSLTTGSSSTCVGEHALGYETVLGGNTAIGNDTMRNANGTNNDTAVGFNALRNSGGNVSSNLVAIGSQAAFGNASSITLAGTPTTNEVITVTFSGATVQGSPVAVTYTEQSNDTLSTIATNLAAAIAAKQVITNFSTVPNGIGANVSGYSGGPPTIGLDFPGSATTGAAVTTAFSSSGGHVTATIGTGMNVSQSTFVGSGVFEGLGAINPAFDVIVGGNGTAPYLIDGNFDVFLGLQAAHNVMHEKQSIFIGFAAGYNQQNWYNNIYVGHQAGYLANGAGNVVLGAQDSTALENCIVGTVFNVTLLGYGACDPTNTSNFLSLNNVIYATGVNGSGTTASTAKVGIDTASPNAELTIQATASSGGSQGDGHIGIKAVAVPTLTTCGTSPSIDTNASDTGGTVTPGSGATACTVNFNIAYQTVPHVVITGWTSTAPYLTSVTTSGFTVTTASKFSYISLQ